MTSLAKMSKRKIGILVPEVMHWLAGFLFYFFLKEQLMLLLCFNLITTVPVGVCVAQLLTLLLSPSSQILKYP